eukprot:GHRQ01028124.1.p1 GENE.GHRQ01028124.1~~GHRQ01028124.1.p1  ORF type:complete len:231 (+),score=81.33 GHRQ01028124.1:840-1532(+)
MCANYQSNYDSAHAAARRHKSDRPRQLPLTHPACTFTATRHACRSDAFMLASRFGSLAEAMQADQEDFAAVPGLGPVKARRLHEAFSQPFKRNLTGVQGPAAAGSAAPAAGAPPVTQDAGAGQLQQAADGGQSGEQQEQQGGYDDVDFDLDGYEDIGEGEGEGDATAVEEEQEASEAVQAEEAEEAGHYSAAGVGVGGSAAAPGFGHGEYVPLPPQDDEFGFDDEVLEEF